MRRSPVPSLLTTALAALALAAPAASAQVAAPPEGPAATTPQPPPPPPAAEPRETTVTKQLAALRDAGRITSEAHDVAVQRYRAARATRDRLSGRRKAELSGVLDTLVAVAKRRQLTSGRVSLAFETLERNRQWWATGALLGYGARTGFAGSELVWQSYPGQGIQVQWLATFGKANGLASAPKFAPRLRRLLDEALAHAAPRAGGIAFESWFTFDGGRPPWVSALSTGTGLQALARAGTSLGEPRYAEAATAALGIFRVKPPEGVRVRTTAGAHYLQYSFAPGLRIVNGFVQALNGLHDYGRLVGGADGQALFAAGEGQLRKELPRTDTGAWSLYSVGGKESDLGYHRLLRDFLRGLCSRVQDPLYCDTAARFTADLTRPPLLAFLPPSAPARKGRTARVRFTLDKVSTVSVVVTRAGKQVYASTQRVARGTRSFTLPKLKAAGELAISLRAVDPAGNASAAAGRLPVGEAPKAARPPAGDDG